MTHPPLVFPWQSHEVRIRHDDPKLIPYSPTAARIGAAMTLAHTVVGLRRVLEATVGDRYDVEVHDEPVSVALRRRSTLSARGG